MGIIVQIEKLHHEPANIHGSLVLESHSHSGCFRQQDVELFTWRFHCFWLFQTTGCGTLHMEVSLFPIVSDNRMWNSSRGGFIVSDCFRQQDVELFMWRFHCFHLLGNRIWNSSRGGLIVCFRLFQTAGRALRSSSRVPTAGASVHRPSVTTETTVATAPMNSIVVSTSFSRNNGTSNTPCQVTRYRSSRQPRTPIA